MQIRNGWNHYHRCMVERGLDRYGADLVRTTPKTMTFEFETVEMMRRAYWWLQAGGSLSTLAFSGRRRLVVFVDQIILERSCCEGL